MVREHVQEVDVSTTQLPPGEGRSRRADLAAQTDDRGQDLGDPLSPITGTLSATELPPLDRRHLRR
jgi:hypothetical protein